MSHNTTGPDKAIKFLTRINSFIRSGQLISANRDVRNLMSKIYDGSIHFENPMAAEAILKQLHKISSLLRPIIDAFGATNRALAIAETQLQSEGEEECQS